MTMPGATISATATRSLDALLDPRLGRRGAILRSSLVLLLFVAYWRFFWAAHGAIGNPAFLLGLVPCIATGALLGARAAVVMVMGTTLLDSVFAQSLPPDAETGLTAAAFATINKLMLGVGVGLLVDSRSRLRETNTRLSQEIGVRKRREKSLEQNYRLHHALVECLGEGVGLFDSENRFLFANPTLAAMLDIPPAELQGRPFSQFFLTPSHAGDGAEGATRGSRSYDAGLKGKEGRLLLVTETLLTQPGTQDVLTLRVLRDLTERLSIERRHKELERVAERNQAFQSLAVLAGGVAHDFNNLLSGVVGNAEVALLQLPESAPPGVSHSLTEIKAFAMEAAQLSRQMLAYAGQRNLAFESVNVNAETRVALRLLHATIESRARLVLDLGEPMPEVTADRHQLRQVVTNLVLNGLEAMGSERGTLTLRTGTERISAERLEQIGRPHALPPGEYVSLSITDTGSGISEELRERIFEPFFSTKSPGRGMGLAAALRIVRSHGGLMHIESTPGAGTTFHLLWPVAPEGEQSVVGPARPEAGTLKEGCVLLIDDEPAVRIVTARLLAELGQRVLVAEDGRTGIELFRKNPGAVSLVVLDLTMPEESGAEVLSELTRLKSDVKVVVSSGYHASDASALLSSPNVLGFLEKPHTFARLEVLLGSLPAA